MLRAELGGEQPWGVIVNTPDDARVQQLKETDPVIKEALSWGMKVEKAGAMCMAEVYHHNFSGGPAAAQIEFLLSVPPDHRARALAEFRGTASHLSQLRSIAQADALVGPKPIVIIEHDQKFTQNGAIFFRRIAKYVVESNLWREPFMIYLGHAQHASAFAGRIQGLEPWATLGELRLFRIQCKAGRAPPWFGTGLRAYMIGHRARALIIGNIKRRAHQDVWVETVLAWHEDVILLIAEPSSTDPNVDPNLGLAFRDSGRVAVDNAHGGGPWAQVKLVQEIPPLEKYLVLQAMRLLTLCARISMIGVSSDNTVHISRLTNHPAELLSMGSDGSVNKLWYAAHHRAEGSLEKRNEPADCQHAFLFKKHHLPGPVVNIFWHVARLQFAAAARDSNFSVASLKPLRVAWEADAAVSCRIDGLTVDPPPFVLVVNEWRWKQVGGGTQQKKRHAALAARLMWVLRKLVGVCCVEYETAEDGVQALHGFFEKSFLGHTDITFHAESTRDMFEQRGFSRVAVIWDWWENKVTSKDTTIYNELMRHHGNDRKYNYWDERLCFTTMPLIAAAVGFWPTPVTQMDMLFHSQPKYTQAQRDLQVAEDQGRFEKTMLALCKVAAHQRGHAVLSLHSDKLVTSYELDHGESEACIPSFHIRREDLQARIVHALVPVLCANPWEVILKFGREMADQEDAWPTVSQCSSGLPEGIDEVMRMAEESWVMGAPQGSTSAGPSRANETISKETKALYDPVFKAQASWWLALHDVMMKAPYNGQILLSALGDEMKRLPFLWSLKQTYEAQKKKLEQEDVLPTSRKKFYQLIFENVWPAVTALQGWSLVHVKQHEILVVHSTADYHPVGKRPWQPEEKHQGAPPVAQCLRKPPLPAAPAVAIPPPPPAAKPKLVFHPTRGNSLLGADAVTRGLDMHPPEAAKRARHE